MALGGLLMVLPGFLGDLVGLLGPPDPAPEVGVARVVRGGQGDERDLVEADPLELQARLAEAVRYRDL